MTSFVYCIQNAAGEIKIGRSGDPERRRRDLQVSSASPLRLVWSRKVAANLVAGVERRAHALLIDYRLGGEWFSATPELALELLELAIKGQGSVVKGGKRRKRVLILDPIEEPLVPGVDLMPHYATRKEMPLERRALGWAEFDVPPLPDGYDDWLIEYMGEGLRDRVLVARAIRITLEGARGWADIIDDGGPHIPESMANNLLVMLTGGRE